MTEIKDLPRTSLDDLPDVPLEEIVSEERIPEDSLINRAKSHFYKYRRAYAAGAVGLALLALIAKGCRSCCSESPKSPPASTEKTEPVKTKPAPEEPSKPTTSGYEKIKVLTDCRGTYDWDKKTLHIYGRVEEVPIVKKIEEKGVAKGTNNEIYGSSERLKEGLRLDGIRANIGTKWVTPKCFLRADMTGREQTLNEIEKEEGGRGAFWEKAYRAYCENLRRTLERVDPKLKELIKEVYKDATIKCNSS